MRVRLTNVTDMARAQSNVWVVVWGRCVGLEHGGGNAGGKFPDFRSFRMETVLVPDSFCADVPQKNGVDIRKVFSTSCSGQAMI